MKIAQIAPIIERVPPRKYGGTERVISALTEELVRRGHEVTLFASGDTITGAELSAICPKSLREAGVTDTRERNGWTLRHIGAAYERAHEFDLIHDHCGVFSLPTAQISPTPVIQTMHGAFFDHNIDVFRQLRNTHLVTISHDHAKDTLGMNHVATIHNGLPMEHYPYSLVHGEYLLYVGRVTPQKGTHLAVQLAHKLKLPLILAAKCDPEQQQYFDQEVAPYLSDRIQWVGEVNEAERNQLMMNAMCFLHPGTWREPFGLTLIEAMACGCPVVALRNGSIPELIEHGKTGYVAENPDEMASYIPQTTSLNRLYCRQRALRHFSAKKMVDEYERLYTLIALKRAQQRESVPLHPFSYATLPLSDSYRYN